MRRNWEGEVNKELQFHLDSMIRDYMAEGLTREEAERKARREFGSVELAKDELRETRSWEWARSFMKDLRISLRGVRQAPAFSLTVIGTLALGIGATATVFSVANAWTLRQLPYAEVDRIVAVFERRPLEAGSDRIAPSQPDFEDWRAQNKVFEGIGGYTSSDFIYAAGGESQRVMGAFITADVLPILGAHVRVGRDFRDSDVGMQRANSVILGDGFWRGAMNADPSAVGKTITLSGRVLTVVGILPENFVPFTRNWQVYLPRELDLQGGMRAAHGLNVIAKLRPGVSLDQSRQDMEAISKRLEQQYPENKGHYANVVPFGEAVRGDLRSSTLALLGAATLVLLIACFNVANLMLARASGRAREIATRLALGAARSRIARQFLTESLLLSSLGALLGVAIAFGGAALLRSILPANPSIVPGDVRIDPTVLALAASLALLTAVICGAVPALNASRAELNGVMREGSRGQSASRTQRWSRSAFVVAETALALVLAVGAGLLLRSFANMLSVDPGFRPEKLLTMQLTLPPSYKETDQRLAFQQRLLASTRALPGVRNAGFTTFLPVTGQNVRRNLEVEGIAHEGREPRRGNIRITSPGYFETMGIPLRSGRTCEDRDAKTPRAVINETAARLYWQGREPVGTRLRFSGIEEWAEVVGVVGDVKHFGLELATRSEVFLCSYQTPALMALAVRTQGEPEALMSAVRLKLREIDPGVPPMELRTMDEVIEQSGASRRFLTVLVSGFAALALLLAAIGIYSQLAYSVAQRTPEIGIRMALGARQGQVIGLVLRQGFQLAAIGLGSGLAAALFLAGWTQKLLFGVTPVDTATFVSAPLILLAVAGLACLIPAWRAARADPASTLRHD